MRSVVAHSAADGKANKRSVMYIYPLFMLKTKSMVLGFV